MSNTLSNWKLLFNYNIDEEVTNISAGVYALTTSWVEGILYVGRSDDDLNKRLKDHVNETSPTRARALMLLK